MNKDRPASLTPPPHLSKSPPVPAPEPLHVAPPPEDAPGPDRTRYGDWEREGICWDF